MAQCRMTDLAWRGSFPYSCPSLIRDHSSRFYGQNILISSVFEARSRPSTIIILTSDKSDNILSSDALFQFIFSLIHGNGEVGGLRVRKLISNQGG